MRNWSLAARSFFASRAKGHRADLFTITLADGTAYRWTSLDRDVTYGDFTWLAQSPNLERVSMSVRNTTEVPELQIKLSALDNDFAGGANVKLAIFQGDFDGARVLYEMLPIPGELNPRVALDTSLGPPVTLFGGRVGEIQVTATGATIKGRGDVVIMSQYAPRNVYQTSCQHRFCDAGCTLNAADFTLIGVDVGAGSTVSSIFWGGTQPANVLQASLGSITFTSGVNKGHKRTIADGNSAGLVLAYPLWFTPAVGDLYDLFLGCNKLLATCTDTYNNRLHFRGFPAVPPASYAA